MVGKPLESRSETYGRMRIGFVRLSWIPKEANLWVAIVGLMTWRIGSRKLSRNCEMFWVRSLALCSVESISAQQTSVNEEEEDRVQ